MRWNDSAIQYPILCTGIAAISVSFLSGCNADNLDSGETRQSESQVQSESQFDIRESDWLSITDDDDALKKAKARALVVNQNDGKPDGLVNAVEATDDPESVEILNQKKETIAKLVQSLTADGFSEKSIRAASQLCHLGEVSGRDYAVQVLREGAPKQRGKILDGIQHRSSEWSDRVREKHEKFLFGDDLLVTAMLQQLDPKETSVAQAAVQSCGMLSVPGFRTRFIELLKEPTYPQRPRICYWLSESDLTADLLDVVIQTFTSRDFNEHWSEHLVLALVRSDNDQVSERAREWLKQALRKNGISISDLYYIDALSETSDDDDLPWLREILDKDVFRSSLGAIIRISEDEGRKRLLDALRNETTQNQAIWAAGEAYADSEDEELVRILDALTRTQSKDFEIICFHIGKIGGEVSRIKLRQLVDRLDDIEAASIRRQFLNAMPLPELLDVIRTSGLLSEQQLKTASTTIKEHITEHEETDDPTFRDVLLHAGIAIEFDVETGQLPCRHDRLLTRFVDVMQGKFKPESVYQTWHQADEEDYEADYTLNFIHQGQLFEGQLLNLDDWYDMSHLIPMVNAALIESGVPERFIPLATDTQIATIVFADPEKLIPLSNKLHMPIAEDFNQAMEAGLKFEDFMRLQIISPD